MFRPVLWTGKGSNMIVFRHDKPVKHTFVFIRDLRTSIRSIFRSKELYGRDSMTTANGMSVRKRKDTFYVYLLVYETLFDLYGQKHDFIRYLEFPQVFKK